MKIFILFSLIFSIFIVGCVPEVITVEEKSEIKSKLIELDDQVSTLSEFNHQLIILLSATPNATSTPNIPPTSTNTPTLSFTSTITPTPTITLTPTATLDQLKMPKSNGMYLVNIDIAPGVWRSDGKNDNCYWKVSTATGKIIDNYFGMAGGTIYIPESGFQVELNDCGTWTFLQNP